MTTFEILETTISGLQTAMENGIINAQQIVTRYLERIEAIDKVVNAILELNPEVLNSAALLDKERITQGSRGPLHGIPLLIKDNIETADRMPTTAGSLALANHFARQDAFSISRLRSAGAIILGKTNLSEWANFRSTRSSSGWSSRGGQTHNPYVLSRNPCGSSSGSGVAVSANLCAAAVGTETDGSIVCPAHMNGIVGLKPTIGLVSRSGIIPIAHSQDTAGPMARTVRDAAILLGGMVGIDSRDPVTRTSNGRYYNDYTQFLDIQGCKGARIGVARNFFGKHPASDLLMEKAIGTLKQLGAEIIDPANIETMQQIKNSKLSVLLYEFKADLNSYLANLDTDIGILSLADLIAYNEARADKVMPLFGQELFYQAQEKGSLQEAEYLAALANNHRYMQAEGIDAVIGKHQLDAIIAPTGGPTWLTDHVNGDHYTGSCSSAAAVAGYPHITVPMGFVAGLPLGISFFAGAFTEPTLLKLAYAFEQATRARKPPHLLSTINPATN
ncbi:MAG: amidase, partial [Anaerolineales bacterium]|nr:amidase [Anaerolineales bacterium]